MIFGFLKFDHNRSLSESSREVPMRQYRRDADRGIVDRLDPRQLYCASIRK